MGEVFRAQDPELHRAVALKVLRNADRSDLANERLRREAQAMARLDHQNVIKVFEVGEDQGRVFLAMELVEGWPLDVWLENGKRSVPDILDVFKQAGNGLACAHDAGLVHRDFKPQNVLIDTKGRARVVDFGLVRHQSAPPTPNNPLTDETVGDRLELAITRASTVVGTPFYMAPEQFFDEPLGPYTDQWGFCVALYESLYGCRPFQGETWAQLLNNVVQSKADPVPSGTHIPRWIEPIVFRGLSPNIEDRWPSMHALVAALGRDPTRRRRIFISVGAGLVATAGAVAWNYVDRQQATAACIDEGQAIADVWNDARAATIATAFAETELYYADDAWVRTKPWLDDYATAWAEGLTQTCIEAQVDGTRTPQQLALSRDCFDEHQVRLATLLGSLEQPQGLVVERSIHSAAGLPSLAPCCDPQQLDRRAALPEDQRVRDEVGALRTRVATAEAKKELGLYQDAASLAREVMTDAEGLDYPPLHIAAQIVAAESLRELSEWAQARELAEEAFLSALSLREDELAIEAATTLALVGYSMRKKETILLGAGVAESLIARSGDPNHPNASNIARAMAWAMVLDEDYDSAVQNAQRSIELAKAIFGDNHPQVGKALTTLGTTYLQMGRIAEAQQMFEQTLELLPRTLGPHDPSVMTGERFLATTLAIGGKLDLALEKFTALLQSYRRREGENSMNVAMVLECIGNVHSSTGQYETAADSLSQSVAIKTRLVGRTHRKVCQTQYNLAISLELAERYPEALKVILEVIPNQEKEIGPQSVEVIRSYTILGQIHRGLGNFNPAMKALTHALSICEAKKSAPRELHLVLGQLGRVELDRQNFRQARQHFERAQDLVKHHESDQVLLEHEDGLARVDLAEGKYASARTRFQNVIDIGHKNIGDHAGLSSSLIGLGQTHLALGEPEAAVAVLERALAQGLEAPRLVAYNKFLLAKALHEKGQDKLRARRLAREAEELYGTLEDRPEERKAVTAWLRKTEP